MQHKSFIKSDSRLHVNNCFVKHCQHPAGDLCCWCFKFLRSANKCPHISHVPKFMYIRPLTNIVSPSSIVQGHGQSSILPAHIVVEPRLRRKSKWQCVKNGTIWQLNTIDRRKVKTSHCCFIFPSKIKFTRCLCD